MHIARIFRTRRAAFGAFASLVATLAAWSGVPAAQAPQVQDLLVDPFTNATSQADVSRLNVDTPGYPCLTAAPGAASSSTIPNCNLAAPDPAGQGTLRFTTDATGSASAIVSTAHLPTSQGLRISFVQYQWGGHNIEGPGSLGGGDGIAFFLASAPPVPDVLGPQGGALGYTSDGGTSGLPHGWLGIGLDAFGSYNSPGFFGSTTCPEITWNARGDEISVRGPAHEGYCLIGSSAASGGLPGGVSLRGPDRPSSRRRIEIVIDAAANTYAVNMDPTGGTNFQPAVTGTLPSSYTDPVTGESMPGLPPRIAFGFSASTGSATDNHEIAEVSVQTVSGRVPVLGLTQTLSSGDTALPGDAFTIDLHPTVDGEVAESATLHIDDVLPSGLIVNASPSGMDWSCTTADTSISCSYTGGYPLDPGTVLPDITIPVAVQGASLGSVLTNSASLTSLDAAMPAHSSARLVISTPLTIDIGSLTPGPGGEFSLPDGTVGVPYSASLTTSGGTAPITWSLVSGPLPTGVTFSPNGVFGGTPTAAGVSSLRLRVADANGLTITAPLSLAIAPTALTIPTTGLPAGPGGSFALPGGTVGVGYSAALSATGGTGTITWSLNGGALPAGLTLASNGAITGTPTAAGTASFTLKATDANGASATVPLSIAVASALSIPTTGLPAGPGGSFALPGGTVGVVYSTALTATGGTGTITWSLNGGALPAGLTLASNGAITGTPTAAGTASFTLKATDANGASATVPLSIAIASPLSIPTTGLPAGPGGSFALQGGTVGVVYSAALTATGGTGTITWSLNGGALPAGLTLASNGAITGTPTAAGTGSFTLKATDANGASASVPLSIAIASALSIPTTGLPAGPGGSFALPGGTVGVVYSAALTATGGTGTITWSLNGGALPAGLTLASNGAIAGTPTAAGTASFTLKATDANGASATVPLSIAIASPLSIPTTGLPAGPGGSFALPGGTVGVVYSASLTATGGTGTITWSRVTGNLPAGLALAANGTITGTPTAAGTASFTLKATDTTGASATVPLSIVIAGSLSIPTTGLPAGPGGSFALPGGTVGVAYSASLTATGGTGTITWSRITGNLPAGLSLASTGTVSGTPTTTGTSIFTLRATDARGASATVALSIAITTTPLRITTTALPGGRVGTPYSFTLSAVGGVQPYTWRANGGLPRGLSLSTAGVISGTPIAYQATNFVTLSVTDAVGRSALQSMTLPISQLAFTTTTLPTGYLDGRMPYDASINTSGAVPNVTFTVISGSLPPGIAMNASMAGCYCARLQGLPTVAGTYTFTVQAVDATGATAVTTLSVRIANISLAAYAPFVLARPGDVINSQAGVLFGPPNGRYTWTITSGTLPAGLTMSPSGLFSGRVTQTGFWTLQLRVVDQYGNVGTAVQMIFVYDPNIGG